MHTRLVIDANLLLLLVIGAVEEGQHISKSKRLGNFDLTDYDNVVKIMSKFNEVCITSYIATEVSNLIDLHGTSGRLAFRIARSLFSIFTEISTSIRDDCSPDCFEYYGITDCSLINLVSECKVLTSDNRLCNALYKVNPENVLQYSSIGN
jgi:rRNA-processing protein FCF1